MSKILIDNNFKAVRKGEYVEASDSNGEFVFCKENEMDLTVGQLRDIAKANNVKLTGSKKAELADELCEALLNLEIPEMNEKTDSQKVKEIVEEGHTNGKSEDDMLIEIVQAGIKFSNATKFLKRAQQELGLAISAKERYAQAKEIMEDKEFAPDTYDEVQEMAQEISNAVPDTTEKQAVSVIRKYCKEIEHEMPKAPKKAAGTPGGFRGQIFDHIEKNPELSIEDFREFVSKHKPADKVDGVVKRFTPIIKMANGIATRAKSEETENA